MISGETHKSCNLKRPCVWIHAHGLLFIMKPFKTYDEQLEILRSRHLLPPVSDSIESIPDPERFRCFIDPELQSTSIDPLLLRESIFTKINQNQCVKAILKEYGYYNIINQYNKPFLLDDGTYQPHTDFLMLFSLQQIDTRMKNVIFYPVLQVEQHLKTCISYEFAKSYGPFECDCMKDYTEPYFVAENYNHSLKDKSGIPKYFRVIRRLEEIYKNKDYKPFVHYKEKHKHVPIWVFINRLSYGELIHFYEVLNIQGKISANFHLSPSQLRTAMIFLNHVRNDCAHFSGFYNQVYPYLKSNIPLLSDFQSHFGFSSQREIPNIFLTLILLKYFLSKPNYENLLLSIRYEVFDLIFREYIPRISEYMATKLTIPTKEDCSEKCEFLKSYSVM